MFALIGAQPPNVPAPSRAGAAGRTHFQVIAPVLQHVLTLIDRRGEGYKMRNFAWARILRHRHRGACGRGRRYRAISSALSLFAYLGLGFHNLSSYLHKYEHVRVFLADNQGFEGQPLTAIPPRGPAGTACSSAQPCTTPPHLDYAQFLVMCCC